MVRSALQLLPAHNEQQKPSSAFAKALRTLPLLSPRCNAWPTPSSVDLRTTASGRDPPLPRRRPLCLLQLQQKQRGLLESCSNVGESLSLILPCTRAVKQGMDWMPKNT